LIASIVFSDAPGAGSICVTGWTELIESLPLFGRAPHRGAIISGPSGHFLATFCQLLIVRRRQGNTARPEARKKYPERAIFGRIIQLKIALSGHLHFEVGLRRFRSPVRFTAEVGIGLFDASST
jgi:hypothetical protein